MIHRLLTPQPAGHSRPRSAARRALPPQRLLQHLPGMVFRLLQQRGEWRFLYTSDAALPVCGVPPATLLRTPAPFFSRIHADDQADFVASLQASALQGDSWNWEGRIDAGDGTKWINIRAAVRRPNRQTVQWDGLMLNVSRGRQREAGWREAALELEAAREGERSQLAARLREQIASVLDTLRSDLHRLADDATSDTPWRALLERLDVAQDTAEQVAWQLRPATLEQGLAEALADLCQRWAVRTGLAVQCHIDPPPRLAADHGAQLFRIAEQALADVAQRGGASRVQLTLAHRPGLLLLDVIDDGVAPASAPDAESAAPLSRALTERARLLGGVVDLGPGLDGRGIAVRVRVPLPAPDTLTPSTREPDLDR